MMPRPGVVLAVVVSVLVAGCTGASEPASPATVGPSASSVPSTPAVTSAMFEEAYRELPMDGTEALAIRWEESEVPESEEVLAARRSLAASYWLSSLSDWTDRTSAIPIVRFTLTDRLYQLVYANSADSADSVDSGGDWSGQIWVKAVGVEPTGPDEAMVTFCTDIGYWHSPGEGPGARDNRALLESYVVTYARAGDGELRWLTDRIRANDRRAQWPKYGADCEEWAQHTP